MKSLSRIVAIRHVPFEDLGMIAPLLQTHGAAIEYVEAPTADLSVLSPEAPDLVVVLGGPIGAYEESAYPFLHNELALIERRLARGLPLLGICLGAQMIARAMGARVYQGASKEIGWEPLALSEAGKESCLSALETQPVLHWHGDTFDLPKGARRLASTETTANQAFDAGPAVLGLQFHIEVTAKGLEPWYVGHACEIAATPGVDVGKLRADAEAFAAGTNHRAKSVLASWLDALPE